MVFRKTAVSLVLGTVVLVIGLLSLIGYYYLNPPAVRDMVEQQLSRITGCRVSIGALSYSLRPGRLQVHDLLLGPKHSEDPVPRLHIAELGSDLRIEGEFGRKALVLTPRIKGFSLGIPHGFDPAGLRPEKEPASVLGKAVKHLLRFFLFQQVRLEGVHLEQGRVFARGDGFRSGLTEIRAGLSARDRLEVSARGWIALPDQGVTLRGSLLRLKTNTRFSWSDPKLEATVRVANATIEGRTGRIKTLELVTDLVYVPLTRILGIDAFDLVLEGIREHGPPLEHVALDRARFQGEGEFDLHQQRIKLKGKLFGDRLAVSRERLRFSSGVKGSFSLTGTLPEAIEIRGGIRAVDAGFKSGSLRVRPFSLALSFSCGYPRIALTGITARVPSGGIALQSREVPLAPLKLEVPTGSLDLKEHSFALSRGRLHSRLFETIRVSLEHDQKQTLLQLKGQEIGLTAAAQTLGLLPQGWNVEGSDRVQLAIRQDKAQGVHFRLESQLQDLGFENRSGSCLGQGLSVRIRAEGRYDLKEKVLTGRTSLAIDQGETLLDRIYFDLQKSPLSLSCGFTSARGENSWSLSGLRIRIRDLLGFETRGTLVLSRAGPEFEGTIHIPETGLAPVFNNLVREPFQATHPLLSELKVQGSLAAELSVSHTNSSWSAQGHCFLRNAGLSFKEQDLLQGVELDLPIRLGSGLNTPLLEVIRGRLSVQALHLPWLPEQPLQLKLSAGLNSLAMPEPTRLNTPGGVVLIGPVRITDLISSRLRLETSLVLDNFRLQPVLAELWNYPVKGSLSGRLDRVVLENRELSSTGVIRGEIFNGRVRLFGLGAKRLFSPVPVYRLSGKASGLDLSLMTTGTAFGRIQGILQGSVQGLEIAAGQPQRFDLLLETVKTRGVSQKISLKAVENIARIGGGQSPFMGFAGTFASFLQNFSYSKIGVRASLENDRFRINGTVTEGGKEYLIKKAGLSGVNVVNSNPDNLISFKDMLKRIKRVTESRGGGNQPD